VVIPVSAPVLELMTIDLENYSFDLENEKKNYTDLYKIKSFQEGDVEKIYKELFNWVIEVQVEFNLNAQTLYLAVNYVDRVLLHDKYPKNALQLLGVTCLFIAAKYEEIFPPDLSKFFYLIDNCYNKDQVLQMEFKVLTSLTYQLSSVSVKDYFNFFWNILRIHENENDYKNLCYYLGELTIPIFEFRKYLPSKIAASIVCFSAFLFSQFRNDLNYWTPEFEQYSRYKKEDLKECIHLLYYHYQEPNTFSPSVLEKYNVQKYGNITNINLPTFLPF